MYGPTSAVSREEFWMELKELNGGSLGDWGDFNVIRFVNEKSSGGKVTPSMRDFDEFMHLSDLKDSPLCNARYTLTNGQDRLVMSRLDRFLVTSSWEDFYPHFFQEQGSKCRCQ